MTYYVCKQCNYKHTFLPLACAKCKGTNFYPLETSEPTGNTSICNRMEIQEDVLKLRIEKEQLEQTNNKLLDVINNQDVKIADLEQKLEKMKCCQNCKHCAKIHDYDLDDEEDSNIEYCEVHCYDKSGWELRR